MCLVLGNVAQVGKVGREMRVEGGQSRPWLLDLQTGPALPTVALRQEPPASSGCMALHCCPPQLSGMTLLSSRETVLGCSGAQATSLLPVILWAATSLQPFSFLPLTPLLSSASPSLLLEPSKALPYLRRSRSDLLHPDCRPDCILWLLLVVSSIQQ